MKTVIVNDVIFGKDRPLVYICGPCVMESKKLTFKVAEKLAELAGKLKVPMIFKSSYTKANRLSGDAYTGPGIEKGLDLLSEVKEKFELPVLTDVHCQEEVGMAAEVADIIQIPAFLCRQTNLLKAAAKTGRIINIKKGQFLAPEDMAALVEKVESMKNQKILLTERGTTFGYHNLVVDMRSLVIMQRTGYPVLFDATHSVQLPGGMQGSSGGQREFILPLARAAVAAGCQGLFVETHPLPTKALCDAHSMLPLDELPRLIEETRAIHETCQRTAK